MTINLQNAKEKVNSTKKAWRQAVIPYSNPDNKRSIWQLINTLVPYFVLWALMYWSLNISYWLTLLLAIPAAGLVARTFIIFHDCGHGSFFKSRGPIQPLDILPVSSLSRLIIIGGIITQFTMLLLLISTAAVRGMFGRQLWRSMFLFPRWKQIFYRFYRNPVVMFIFNPTLTPMV